MSSHTFGKQNPVDFTNRLTNLNNFIIVNKPIYILITILGGLYGSSIEGHLISVFIFKGKALPETSTNGEP